MSKHSTLWPAFHSHADKDDAITHHPWMDRWNAHLDRWESIGSHFGGSYASRVDSPFVIMTCGVVALLLLLVDQYT